MKLMEVGVIDNVPAADAPGQINALAAQGLQVQVKITCVGCGVLMTCRHHNIWVEVAECPLCGTNFRAEAVTLFVTVDRDAVMVTPEPKTLTTQELEGFLQRVFRKGGKDGIDGSSSSRLAV